MLRTEFPSPTVRHDARPPHAADAALTHYANTARQLGVEPWSIKAVATSAARRAMNAETWLARVQRRIGVRVRIISGDEEARLTWLGATRDLDFQVRKNPNASADDDLPREVLIVASKLKKYVKARSGMNTSDRVLEPLSEIVRRACDAAIRRAGEDGRKTVLDRDFIL